MARPRHGKPSRPTARGRRPLPLERLVDGVVFLGEPGGPGDVRWWLEGRPEEGGRQVLVRREADGTDDPPDARRASTPGRASTSTAAARPSSTGDLIVVSDFADRRLHRVVAPGAPRSRSRRRPTWRFADLELDARRNRLIAVREDHSPEVVERHGEWVNDARRRSTSRPAR